jgi:hypothetical protein
MCYSWHEDVDKSVQNDVAQEDSRKTVPKERPERRVRSEQPAFWTFLIGPRAREPEKATADRTLEKV